MNRLEATRTVVAHARDAAIISSLGHPTYDLFAARDRPQNFYTWGSMGIASSIGLGLALARPAERVIVIDGDGSLLMNLGSLATIGLLQPPNLVLIVMDNGEYATTGRQPTATASGADLAAAASAMGISSATAVHDADQLSHALRHTAKGPHVIVARVSESTPIARPSLDCLAIKTRFMTALGCPEP